MNDNKHSKEKKHKSFSEWMNRYMRLNPLIVFMCRIEITLFKESIMQTFFSNAYIQTDQYWSFIHSLQQEGHRLKSSGWPCSLRILSGNSSHSPKTYMIKSICKFSLSVGTLTSSGIQKPLTLSTRRVVTFLGRCRSDWLECCGVGLQRGFFT